MTQEQTTFPIYGGCDCKAVRYGVISAPLIVHCCHCRWCQRESGAAFALNAMIESGSIQSLGIAPDLVSTPSQSGRGQQVARCPKYRIAVWSHYAGSGPITSFVRVGTLDSPDVLPPDVHIFVESKQPWMVLPDDALAFPQYYDRATVWAQQNLERFGKLRPLIEEYRARAAGSVPRC